MQDYRDLTVWQKAMDLSVEIYQLSKRLPKEELYALSDQMRRATVSIASNISEGYGRNSVNDYIRFLNIAKGSKNEVETQLLLCVRLGYLKENEVEKALTQCDEIGRMLYSLIQKLRPET